MLLSSQTPRSMARRLAGLLLGLAMTASGPPPVAAETQPILLGVDGEFGLQNSTSAQAVELGVRIAVRQINDAGGVLGGRPLAVVTKDNRSIPARGIRNIKEFAAMPQVVAVFGGRFSPVVIEELPTLKEAKLPFLAVWSAADAIIDNGTQPNYVFRLSLRDSLAMPFMLEAARRRGVEQIGLLLTNTSWGRSNRTATAKHVAANKSPRIVGTVWYNWQEKSLIDKYEKLRAAGAQAVILVANDDEGAVLMREMAELPPNQRLPIISHWGITGGKFAQTAGAALQAVDLTVVQTFSFFKARKEPLKRFMAAARKFGIQRIEDIDSPVGVAHAYDMTHILARAINMAGSTDRSAIRNALEQVTNYDGLVRYYDRPFTADRHEALTKAELLMARYRADGVLVPAKP